MNIVRPLVFQSLIAMSALALLGSSCPKIKAAEPEISIQRLSFCQSALNLPQVSLPRAGQVQMAWSVSSAMLANWVTEIMNKSETWLNNRTHMIQFCAIGMVLALIIIWWRKT
jgi:hypothetical protein